MNDVPDAERFSEGIRDAAGRPTLGQSLQEVIREALAAMEAGPRKPPSRPAPPPPLEHVMKAAREAIDRPAGSIPRPVRSPAGGAIPNPRPRRRGWRTLVVNALVVAALIAGAATAWFALASTPGKITPDPIVVERGPSKLRVGQADRAPATQAMDTLKSLQSISGVDVPFRVYLNRVALAKSDAERAIQAIGDADVRTLLYQALALHTLAASAWKTKTVNTKDKWEAIAEDPGLELCAPVKRLLALSDESPNAMSRGQWRGMTVAAAIPVLWDCAAERIGEIEQAVK